MGNHSRKPAAHGQVIGSKSHQTLVHIEEPHIPRSISALPSLQMSRKNSSCDVGAKLSRSESFSSAADQHFDTLTRGRKVLCPHTGTDFPTGEMGGFVNHGQCQASTVPLVSFAKLLLQLQVTGSAVLILVKKCSRRDRIELNIYGHLFFGQCMD
ncbi:hypothetical protein KIN20_008145 [Parelaphostrongylus tenuis]|uniref:Uncharacterized protein n=1 Tax=Parelaphostrongylus tenuis TaxID=148309 RepID=A0AAD5M4B9_PARTN|nr:hypothetical protein KIN20_008145 [Parelaphostrongylus tenuis]